VQLVNPLLDQTCNSKIVGMGFDTVV